MLGSRGEGGSFGAFRQEIKKQKEFQKKSKANNFGYFLNALGTF